MQTHQLNFCFIPNDLGKIGFNQKIEYFTVELPHSICRKDKIQFCLLIKAYFSLIYTSLKFINIPNMMKFKSIFYFIYFLNRSSPIHNLYIFFYLHLSDTAHFNIYYTEKYIYIYAM